MLASTSWVWWGKTRNLMGGKKNTTKLQKNNPHHSPLYLAFIRAQAAQDGFCALLHEQDLLTGALWATGLRVIKSVLSWRRSSHIVEELQNRALAYERDFRHVIPELSTPAASDDNLTYYSLLSHDVEKFKLKKQQLINNNKITKVPVDSRKIVPWSTFMWKIEHQLHCIPVSFVLNSQNPWKLKYRLKNYIFFSENYL